MNWNGNAGKWLKNASKAGWSTTTDSQEAKEGAIIVWTGGSSGYGHVGIVTSVTDSGIVVSEMNIEGKNIVSTFEADYDDLDRGNLSFAGYILPQKATEESTTKR